jgi:hypothetical protein
MSNTADVIGGKTMSVWSQFISGANAINPLVERERSYSFILSMIPQEARRDLLLYDTNDRTQQ